MLIRASHRGRLFRRTSAAGRVMGRSWTGLGRGFGEPWTGQPRIGPRPWCPGADRNVSEPWAPSHRLTPAPQQIYGRRRFQKLFLKPYSRRTHAALLEGHAQRPAAEGRVRHGSGAPAPALPPTPDGTAP